jgi:hypothetical protein
MFVYYKAMVIRLAKLWIWLVVVTAAVIPARQGYCASSGSKTSGNSTNNRRLTGPSSFKADMTFEQAINILRNSTVPPLNISVLWRDIEANAGITRDTTIGIDGVSGVPLRTHLKLLLSSISANSPAKLGFVAEGGVIIIATEQSLPRRLRTVVYYIADLVAR